MSEVPVAVSSVEVADLLACTHKAALARDQPPSVDATDETLAAMVSGHDLIAPATLRTRTAAAVVDALHRVPRPSDLGPWSYEPHDTDLSRTDPTRALVLLADVALQLQTVQGRLPDRVHLMSVSGTSRTVPTRDLNAFARRARARAEAFAVDPPPTVARLCDHCRRCPFQDRCRAEWTERDDVSLVAGAFGRVIEQLAARGIETTAQLAAAPDEPPAGIDPHRYRTLTRQARLQLAARSGPDRYEVLPPDEYPTGGFSLLPPPDPGDLFFDLEGDPHRGNGGLEYLWGLSDVHDRYRSWWGHTATDERTAFETVIDLLTAHLEAHPRAHVFHYAPYETDVLRRLALRHASREDQVHRLLDDRRLVDLYRVVRQTVATSRPGYGMKQLEHFYRNGRETDVQDGLASVIAYEGWLSSGDQSLLDDIQAYNRDDCISTRQLRDWLEDRRIECTDRHGTPEDQAPPPPPTPLALPPRTDRARRLAERLRSGLPDALDQRDDTQRRDDLLLHLLEWQRREDRRRPPPDPDDDAADSHRPDPDTIRRAAAVEATVEAVLAGRPRGRAFDAILRRAPSLPPEELRPRPGETAADVVVRAGRALDHGALAVQAPPGTGLATTIARLVTALTDDGRTVALCAADAAAEAATADVTPHQRVTAGRATDFLADERAEPFDVLILTGAARAGLADLAAVATRACSLVLCGDPAGLDRPRVRGRHPIALRASVLAHLLDGAGTIPPQLGVLLDESTRMAPTICRVVSDIVYDGRLRPALVPTQPDPPHHGTGVRWVPVDHTGRTTACPEEAEVVTALVASLVPDGGYGEILVATPFGDHARLLAEALPDDCRVGTLQQVQHESAPIVVYSLAVSSPDAIPGGRNQVYSRHRLAAALSCARELAVVVGNPSLLDARCRTPRDIAQLNAMLRLQARVDPHPAPGPSRPGPGPGR